MGLLILAYLVGRFVFPFVRFVFRHLDEALEIVLGASLVGIYLPRWKRKANLAIAGPVANAVVYFFALIALLVVVK